MKKIQFYISLWGGKFFLWIWKLRGKLRDDKPGMAALKLYPDFLPNVAKPPLTVVVTGTNGKTTISSFTAEILRNMGKKVAFNDWGANHHAGHARLLLDSVNIFNRPTKDAAVIETDELISHIYIPSMHPNYLIVNNVARDSMLRNANPKYIAGEIKKTIDACDDNTLILLNADDPLSCFLAEGKNCVYFGAEDLHTNPYENTVNDFGACPVCGAKPEYKFRNYRHIGEFVCPKCHLTNPKKDFSITKLLNDGTQMAVKEKDGNEYVYPVISRAIHNIYNTVALIALFRSMGYSPKQVSEELSKLKMPETRETHHTIGNTQLLTMAAKSQNATAVSSVCETVAKDDSDKIIVLLLDEIYPNPKKLETINYLYDIDFEFLNKDNIKRIICAGPRCLDTKLRLLLAGIDKEKIFAVDEAMQSAELVYTKGIEKIIIMNDVFSISRANKLCEKIKETLSSKGEE